MKLTFELTTPERIVEKKEVDGVTLPTQEGEITVLPGHIPLVSNLRPGVVTLHEGKEQEYLAVSGGFIEVQPDGRLIVLADTAERAEELDMEKIEAAREEARKALEEKRGMDDVAATAMLASLEREIAREQTARKYRDLKRRPRA
ncbi:MAG: ATP synthase F1 subunit epsilon [Patescibacteria group bacterium]|nr:ATP synthase F1 subunit epsilon [Patescibacteria group bacterium]